MQKEKEIALNVENRLSEIIQPHLRTLAIKASQTITQDDYGNNIFDRWFQELGYFIDNVLRKHPVISNYLHEDLIQSLQAAGRCDDCGCELPNF